MLYSSSWRIIPQRELRNNIAAILRAAEAGTEFTVTVRGRPVARLGPRSQQSARCRCARRGTPAGAAEAPVDDSFAADITGLRAAEAPAEDPWSGE
jgi:prevent-host-death family protein